MTKMPDKIYANSDKTWEPAYFGDSYVRKLYVSADLIPQPVTDEARAKALEALEDIKDTFDPDEWPHDYDDIMGDIATIKAALSQPVPVIHVDEVVYVGEDDKVLRTETVDRPLQPEAIQKAVEALDIGRAYVLTSIHTKILTCDEDTNDLLAINKALEGLRTHQSELESLKAENASLSIHLDGCRSVLAETEERERALITERDDLRRKARVFARYSHMESLYRERDKKLTADNFRTIIENSSELEALKAENTTIADTLPRDLKLGKKVFPKGFSFALFEQCMNGFVRLKTETEKENADLRRAVIGFDFIDRYKDRELKTALNECRRKHAATIAKAKAVQNV